MANIEVFRGSTPSFQYSIVDAEDSLVDVSDMGIGMTIYSSKISILILPRNLNGESVSYLSNSVSADSKLTLQDDSYCRNHGEGKFSVKMPIAASMTAPGEHNYEVFLFKRDLAGNASEVVDEDGERAFTRGLAKYSIVTIDSGTIAIVGSGIPSVLTRIIGAGGPAIEDPL